MKRSQTKTLVHGIINYNFICLLEKLGFYCKMFLFLSFQVHNVSPNAYKWFLNVADKITRSLNIIFVDKKYDVSILSNYIFGFA